MEAREIGERCTAVLRGRGASIVAAFLFGSRARGEAAPGSDVDVAVLLADPPPRTLDGLALDLAGDMERDLGIPVDLVVLNGAPAELVHEVLKDGRLLVENDAGRRVAFEIRRRAEYFDLLPHLARYRHPERSVRMTERHPLRKKLACIETCIHELRTLARADLVEGDVRERRFVEHTLQLAIQAALDAASHVVSSERLGSVRQMSDRTSRARARPET